ncbi:MAG TPA: SCO1664 family protein [Dehalococcoidia bacterium]|nr:SCO1664 family protein [Dehalococcoidia bacterium]
MMLDRDELDQYARYQARAIQRLLASRPSDWYWDPTRPDVATFMHEAEFVDCDVIPSGSNWTYLVTLSHPKEGPGLAVYKPRDGEAPLWDFPFGTLYLRELAAYELSRLLGWDIVPPTIVRRGPNGIGSLQLFIQADLAANFFTLRRERPDEFRRFAVFDFLANNADRKGGHCLLDANDGRVWGIDHGLTFHQQWKLRTVIWDYRGEPIPDDLVVAVARLAQRMEESPHDFDALYACLSQAEQQAFRARVRALLDEPCFPLPRHYRSVPWPPI